MPNDEYYLQLNRAVTKRAPDSDPTTFAAGDLVPCRYLVKPEPARQITDWSFWSNSDIDCSFIYATDLVDCIYVREGSEWIDLLEDCPVTINVTPRWDEVLAEYDKQWHRRNRAHWNNSIRRGWASNPYRPGGPWENK